VQWLWEQADDAIRSRDSPVLPAGSQANAAPALARRDRFHVVWIAAAVLVVALAALLGVHLREPHPVEHTMRFLLPLPD
jgi:hypothetical protein